MMGTVWTGTGAALHGRATEDATGTTAACSGASQKRQGCGPRASHILLARLSPRRLCLISARGGRGGKAFCMLSCILPLGCTLRFDSGEDLSCIVDNRHQVNAATSLFGVLQCGLAPFITERQAWVGGILGHGGEKKRWATARGTLPFSSWPSGPAGHQPGLYCGEVPGTDTRA